MQKFGGSAALYEKLATGFHVSQRGLIENIYRSKGVDPHIFGMSYMEPGLRALKYLDKGKVEGAVQTVRGKVPVVSGSAPVVALALWLHGLDEEAAKKAPIAQEFQPYAKRALELLEAYKNYFFPLASRIEQSCEYSCISETGGYAYVLEPAPLARELRTAVGETEMLKHLFAMRAMDEWTKLGNLGKTRFIQTEPRSEMEVAVAVLHLYGPIMERMRYHLAAQEMYDMAFSKLEPKTYSSIEGIKKEARYIKENFWLLSDILDGITKKIGDNWHLIGRIKSAYGYYRKVLREKAEEIFKGCPGKERDAEIEKYMRASIQMPIDEKIALLKAHLSKIFDMFGYRLLLTTKGASPLDCKAAGEMIKEDKHFFRYANHCKDYISQPKENGYSSYHVACRLSEKAIEDVLKFPVFTSGKYKRIGGEALEKQMRALLPLTFGFQVSTVEMDLANNHSDERDHSKHKRNITAELCDIEKMLAVSQTEEKPLLEIADITLYLSDEQKNGKLRRNGKPMAFKGIHNIYEAGFIPFKVQKELEQRGKSFLGCSQPMMGKIEEEIKGKKSASISVELVRHRNRFGYKIEDVKVYPRKVE